MRKEILRPCTEPDAQNKKDGSEPRSDRKLPHQHDRGHIADPLLKNAGASAPSPPDLELGLHLQFPTGDRQFTVIAKLACSLFFINYLIS